MVDCIKNRINLPVNQGPHRLQFPATKAELRKCLFPRNIIKTQHFIICLYKRLISYLLPSPCRSSTSRFMASIFWESSFLKLVLPKRNKLVFELDIDLRKCQLNLEWAKYLAPSVNNTITSCFTNERPTWITIASDVMR